jgi:hypothetical protein
VLYRVDMEDIGGTLMCECCADDALDSGLYADGPMLADESVNLDDDLTEEECGLLDAQYEAYERWLEAE